MLKNFIVTVATYAYWLAAVVYTGRAAVHLDAADLFLAALYASMGYTLNKDAHAARQEKPPKADDDTPSAA